MSRRIFFLALFALALAASAGAQATFDTPGTHEYSVSASGALTIEARGADGGNSLVPGELFLSGGSGATLEATFRVQAGDQILVIVGEAGGEAYDEYGFGGGGGGGGGTAVYLIRGFPETLLLVAGAGGGGFDLANSVGGGASAASGSPGGGLGGSRDGGGGGGGHEGDGGNGDGSSPFAGGGRRGNVGPFSGGSGGNGADGGGDGGDGYGGGGGASEYGGGGGGGYGGGGGGDEHGGGGGSSFVETSGTNGFIGTSIGRTDGTNGGGTGRNGAVTLTLVSCNGACYVDASATGDSDGTSWDNAFPTLTAALAATTGVPTVIHVAEGTYTPTDGTDRSASFVVPSGVQILGGYAAGGGARDVTPNDGVTDTVLSGDIGAAGVASDNSYHVVYMVGSPAITSVPGDEGYTLLDGLTVTGGNANGIGAPDGLGGGLFCDGMDGKVCNPALVYVAFVGNAATEGGAVSALGLYDGTSSPSFTNATFAGNSASDYGGAVSAHGSYGTSSPSFTNTTFAGNSASKYGGAVFAFVSYGTSSPSFTNATFAGNSASDYGGAVFAFASHGTSSPSFANAIVWGNTAPSGAQLYLESYVENQATITIDHTVVEGGCDGVALHLGAAITRCEAVTDADPLFADPANGDYSLRLGSPAIDAGLASFLSTDTYDLDGDGDTDEALSLDLAGRDRQRDGDSDGALAPDLGAIEAAPALVLTGGPDGPAWHLVAAPQPGLTVGGLLGPIWTQGYPGSDLVGADPNVLRYVEPIPGPADAGWAAPGSAADPVGAGRGLAAFVFADDDFDGTPEAFPKWLAPDGDGPGLPFSAFPLSFTDADGTPGPSAGDGWSLVGNPAFAPIDWDAVERGSVDGTVYVWDPLFMGGAYRTWNGLVGDLDGGVIPPYRGFFVQTTAEGATMTVPEAARVTADGAAPAARTAERLADGEAVPHVRLEVRTADGAAHSSLFVMLADGARPGKDALDGWRLPALAASPATLYTAPLADDGAPEAGRLAVSAVPPPVGAPLDVPVWVEAAAGEPLSLAWTGAETVPAGWRIELVDAVTGQAVDLRAETSLAFTADGGSAGAASRMGSAGALPLPVQGRSTDAASGVAGGAVAATSATDGPARFALRVVPAGATADEPVSDAPAETALAALWPNPVADRATVRFTLAAPADVALVVVDALGREVARLADGLHAAGWHEAPVTAASLPAGVYFVRLAVGGRVLDARPLTVAR